MCSIAIEPAAIPALPVQLVMRAGFRPDPAVDRFVDRLLRQATRVRSHLATTLAPHHR